METQTASAVEKPRFRGDLVAKPVEEEGVRYVDVTDPNSGSTFRFYDVEYSIACAMDGARDLAGLAEWTRAELGIETSADELAGVVTTLAELGYLEAAAEGGTNGAVVMEFPTDNSAPSGDPAAEISLGEGAAAAAGEDSLELGPPGKSAMPRTLTAPEVQAAELELGDAGGVADANDGVASSAGLEAPSLELGAPGGTGDVHESPTREMSAMAPPAVEHHDGKPEEIHELGSEAMMEVDVSASAPPPPPPVEDEMSFAGIVDGSDVVAPPPSARRPMSNVSAQGLDDEPTQLPGAVVDDDDENVSVDLSAHISLDANEVKEAVRASKVIMVPEIPKDLLEEDERREAAVKAVEAAEREASLDDAAPPPPLGDTASLSALAQSAMPLPPPPEILKPPAVPAIKLPSSAPGARIEPTRAPAAAASGAMKKKSNTGMMVVLVLLLLAAGGLALWQFVLKGDDDKGYGKPPAANTNKQNPPPKGPVDPGKKPIVDPGKQPVDPGKQPVDPGKQTPAPAAKLELQQGASVDATAASDGLVERVLVAKGATVTAGTPLVNLTGAADADYALRDGTRSRDKHQKLLDEATAAGDERAAAAEQKTVGERQKKIDVATAALEKLVVKAPADGTVELLKGNGQKVTTGEVVARVSGGAPALAATFEAGADAAAYAKSCTLALKSKLDQSVACVATVAGTKVTARVVGGTSVTGFKAGDEVVLFKK